MPGSRYSRVAILLHWTIALLIVFNLWLGLADDSLPEAWPVMPVHKAVGITILALTLVRIAWRLTHRPPPLPDTMPRWERLGARLSHALLYVFMLVMPLSGWLLVSNGETLRPLTWFWLFDIPYLRISPAVGEIAHTMHERLGWPFMALIVLHVAAALKHHLVDRDAVLARMAPLFRQRRSA